MARMQDETVSRAFEHFAGIDISKAHLDLAVWSPAGQGGPVRRGKTRLVAQRFGNDPAGIAALLAGLGAPHLVVIEPTGRYHYALWAALAGAGHGAAPINPYRARCLAPCQVGGRGQLAKTDAITPMFWPGSPPSTDRRRGQPPAKQRCGSVRYRLLVGAWWQPVPRPRPKVPWRRPILFKASAGGWRPT